MERVETVSIQQHFDQRMDDAEKNHVLRYDSLNAKVEDVAAHALRMEAKLDKVIEQRGDDRVEYVKNGIVATIIAAAIQIASRHQ